MLRFLLFHLAILLALIATPLSFADDKSWTEVRSPHFRVITDGSEAGARRLAREFEQMRAVFASQFPGYRLETAAPLLVVAPRDEGSAKQVAPEIWERKGVKPGGVYSRGWERQYAFVRMDTVSADPMLSDAYSTIYHEYVHSLLHMNFRWLPTWLDEGLASFYEYTRFERSRAIIGAPPRNSFWNDTLERGSLIPMDVFLTIGPGSPYYFGDQTKTYLFYAQAWAVTHFLTFGPGMEQGQKLKQFFNLLQQGMEQKKAFQQVFGEFSVVDKELQRYVLNWSFTAGELPGQLKVDDSEFSVRKMSPAETEAELAAFHILFHRWEEMRELSEAAVKDDPKLGLAHEDMGYFQFNEGKNEDALREFSQAFELDGKLYRSLFAKTMMSPMAASSDPNDQKAFHDQLLKVLDLNPDFAPAYIELAKMYVRQGDLAKALSLARKAEQLEPTRDGYHDFAGRILLAMGRGADAAEEAAFVANRWGGFAYEEAMNLWNSVPASQRPTDAPRELPAPAEWVTAAGVVKQVTCGEHSYTIVLDRDGDPLTLHSAGTPFFFADTHWWGKDHFTPCFHVIGLPALVHFKADPHKSSVGELGGILFREDLHFPPSPPAKTPVVQKQD